MKVFRRLALCTGIAALTIAPLQADAVQILNRWGTTATDGSGLSVGDSTTLTWSIIDDTVNIPGAAGEPASGSDLISKFDSLFDLSSTGGADLTQRAWYSSIFESSFDRISALSGITYVYEPNDDGALFSSSQGVTGTRGDVRIGGHSVDGAVGSNTLAYNFFPNNGDMVIDTDNANAGGFYANGSNAFRAARNVIMHEALHGVGIRHVESSDGAFLMEPFTNTSFDGPQFDDILGLHSSYGDFFEKNGGNDSFTLASSLGTINDGSTAQIGTDAGGTVVASTAIDFVSIDGNSDVDFWSFAVTGASTLDALLNPQGPTYNQGPQGGSQSSFDSDEILDLALEILDTDGTTVLATINSAGLGADEIGNSILLAGAGAYFARISGTTGSLAQFYQLDLSITAAATNNVPAPVTLALAAFGVLSVACARRRRQRTSAQSTL